ncbi:MAG: amidophosphoribosyltransferase, partial [Betaproteobacteria bacterium]
KRAVTKSNPALTEFEASCFDGNYVTGDVTRDYLSRVAGERDPGRGQSAEELDANEELSLAGN